MVDPEVMAEEVGKIQEIVKDNYLDEGIEVLAAAFSSTLVMAIRADAFDRNGIHTYMEELEARIMAATRKNANAKAKFSGMKREKV
jgi:hypothetical protein